MKVVCLCFRAVVIQANGEGTSTVRFVDYGTSEEVINSKLKVLPATLRVQLPTALQCTIQQQAVMDMGLESFTQAVNGRELACIVTGDNEPYTLSIPELVGQGDAPIKSVLKLI